MRKVKILDGYVVEDPAYFDHLYLEEIISGWVICPDDPWSEEPWHVISLSDLDSSVPNWCIMKGGMGNDDEFRILKSPLTADLVEKFEKASGDELLELLETLEWGNS